MLLKDYYNETYVQAFGDALCQVYPHFDVQAFRDAVFAPGWEALELKQRMRHITHTLGSHLPSEYREAVNMLYKVTPLMANHGFPNMVFPDFVEVYGLDDFEASIPALAEFTQLVSAEFAVRPFIIRYPERMMAQMLRWAHSENPHHRRLASEGCRPRLPWGIAIPALKINPAPILPILEQLRCDPVEMVHRSVANNLNDIAKDHPDVVITTLQRWHSIETDEMQWIIQHALRTLVKRGNPQALHLLGYRTDADIEVTDLHVTPACVAMGDKTRLHFDIRNAGDEAQPLMIDFVVHYVRSRGKVSQKVFKLTKRTLNPGETQHLQHAIDFKPITTRRYYPGTHKVSVQVNGQVLATTEFELVEAG